MLDPPVSVQLYTLRDRIVEDLPGTLVALAEIGFTVVEPHKFSNVPAMAAALKGAGLTAPSAHAQILGTGSEGLFEAAAQLGISTLIQPRTELDSWESPDTIRALADGLNSVAVLAESYGITIGYHNHAFELECVFDGVPGLEILAQHLLDDVVLEVDTFWVEVGGVNAVELLGRLGSRAALLHMKDGPLTKDTHKQLPLGQGVLPIPEILSAAPHARAVIELDAYEGDPLDAVAQSFHYLREVAR